VPPHLRNGSGPSAQSSSQANLPVAGGNENGSSTDQQNGINSMKIMNSSKRLLTCYY
jgi:hypothetical protein